MDSYECICYKEPQMVVSLDDANAEIERLEKVLKLQDSAHHREVQEQTIPLLDEIERLEDHVVKLEHAYTAALIREGKHDWTIASRLKTLRPGASHPMEGLHDD